jgi:hypothetical protein
MVRLYIGIKLHEKSGKPDRAKRKANKEIDWQAAIVGPGRRCEPLLVVWGMVVLFWR